jgi:response regulator NasT
MQQQTLSSPDDLNRRVAVVDSHPFRAALLLEGLHEAGYTGTIWIQNMANLMRQLQDANPDALVIGLENPSQGSLEHMFEVSRAVRRPVAMFVDQSDPKTTAAALDAGVSAYVVNGLKKERVCTILEMAILRYKASAQLRDELERMKTELQERKLIERAKGVVMKQKNLDEAGAYALLRRTAMNQNRRIASVAQQIVSATKILD